MSTTTLWWYFWVFAFVTAGLSFAVIAAVVLVRGLDDLREMIRLLEEEKRGASAEGAESAPGGLP